MSILKRKIVKKSEVDCMSNSLQKMFDFKGSNVRVIMNGEEPWFVAKDVCDVLDIKNHNDALSRLSDSMKGVGTTDTLGGSQKSAIVSEAGVYKIVFTSRKPEAEEFTDWLAKDVLPSIRKHGAYMTAETIEKTISDPDFIIGLVTKLKEEKQKREVAERVIEEQKPLVGFAERILKTDDNILVREMAKIISDQVSTIGQNKLYNKLREWKLIMPTSTEPYQSAMNKGLFVVEEVPIKTAYGDRIEFTTRVTPKGQVYIVEKYREEMAGK